METKTTDTLNEILRGERAALKTYDQVMEKVGDDPRAADLRSLRSDHEQAISALSQHVKVRGDEADDTSGAWGTFAKTVTGTAKIFGDKAALKALKEGEEHGLKQYNSALDEDIDPKVKQMIQQTFIPNQRSHITAIDGLMERM